MVLAVLAVAAEGGSVDGGEDGVVGPALGGVPGPKEGVDVLDGVPGGENKGAEQEVEHRLVALAHIGHEGGQAAAGLTREVAAGRGALFLEDDLGDGLDLVLGELRLEEEGPTAGVGVGLLGPQADVSPPVAVEGLVDGGDVLAGNGGIGVDRGDLAKLGEGFLDVGLSLDALAGSHWS